MKIQPGTRPEANELSDAENYVVDLLKRWNGEYSLPGLTLVNVNVPAGRGAVRQVDALVFTPDALVVVEITGLARPQQGTLDIPWKGPWTVNGHPAALHALSDATPLQQLHTNLSATKEALAKADLAPRYLPGVVIVVGHGLTLGEVRAEQGFHVALATHEQLRAVLHRARDRRPVWSANRVRAACDALDLSSLAPDRDVLLAEGFLEQTSPASASASQGRKGRGSASVRAVPATRNGDTPATAGPTAALSRPSRADGAGSASATARRPDVTRSGFHQAPAPASFAQVRPASEPDPDLVTGRTRRAQQPPQPRRWPTVLVLGLLLAIGVCACVWVYTVFHGG